MNEQRWIYVHIHTYIHIYKKEFYSTIKKQGLPRLKDLPANAGNARDASLIPGLGRSSGVGSGTTPVCLPG